MKGPWSDLRERWQRYGRRLERKRDKIIADRFGSGRLGSIVRVETQQKVAALTFDDGPHPVYTPRLLETLAAHGATGTFFMLGERANRYPELVELVADAGHTIGNHSWDHRSFPNISGRARRNSIRSCQRVLGSRGSKLVRPPYGDQNLSSKLDTLLLGMETILWDIPADDWLSHSNEKLYRIVQDRLRPGSIVLFHDALYSAEKAIYAERTPTIEAVDELLASNPEYSFVSIPELIRAGKPVRQFRPQTSASEDLDRLIIFDERQPLISGQKG